MSNSSPTLSDPAVAEALDVLKTRLSRKELRGVFESLASDHAELVDPTRLIQQQQTDRFCEPSAIDAGALATASSTALAHATEGGFDAVQLSPFAPLGASPHFGYVAQSNLVTTARLSEVNTDPTNALALVGATRRRIDRDPADVTRLAAVQRVVRARQFDAPGALPHFSMLGLVTIGPNRGSRRFEVDHITTTTTMLVRIIDGLRPRGTIRIEVSDNSGRRDEANALVEALGAIARTDLAQPGPDSKSHQPHLGTRIVIDAGDDTVEVGSASATTMAKELTGRDDERMVVGRLSLDRVLDITAPRHRAV